MAMIGSIEKGKRKRGESHHDDDDRDRISKLPHEIIIYIISKLTLREAIATRILSTRWRSLCTKEYATHLNFPRFDFSICDRMAMRRRFGNYINMINQIVDSHKAPKLKEFSVHMNSIKGATMEKWLVFALSKHVEIIDIHLGRFGVFADYSFKLRNIIMQLPLGLRSLKKLSLSGINVEESEIGVLLCNSPQLESLSIAYPGWLTRVSVCGQPAFMLKHLEIYNAPDLKLLDIVNMINLVSISLYNLATGFVLALDNVPKLVQVTTSCTLLNEFSRLPPSIHTLKIRSHGMNNPTVGSMIPIFKGVKHVELQSDYGHLNPCLWRFFAVLQRCPSMEELVINLYYEFRFKFRGYKIDEADVMIINWLPIRKGDLFPSLKKMKLWDFIGSTPELKLIISILNNANSLEELTVRVCDATEEIRLLATARALQHIRPILQESTRLQLI